VVADGSWLACSRRGWIAVVLNDPRPKVTYLEAALARLPGHSELQPTDLLEPLGRRESDVSFPVSA
jgi:hypothetical protein